MKKAGLKNIWVSNGYMTKGCLDLIAPYLDAINIDLKGFSEENYLKYSVTVDFEMGLEKTNEWFKR